MEQVSLISDQYAGAAAMAAVKAGNEGGVRPERRSHRDGLLDRLNFYFDGEL
jgi:hypothetical protein